jgi:signal transduction histidine kinase
VIFLALIVSIWIGVQWRMGAHAQLLRLQFDSRLQERNRVARDLHDTLMQTVVASKVLVDSSQELESVASGRAVFKRLSGWLERAVEEGRSAMETLRSPADQAHGLVEAFEVAALEERGAREIETMFIRQGEVRDLHPVVRDEAYRIGIEAFRNACAHSGASRIVTAVCYGQSLTVRISDNGGGIDEAIAIGGKPGHFGITGMRERAEAIGGALRISTSSTGTEVELQIPGKLAYTKQARWAKLRLAFRSRV